MLSLIKKNKYGDCQYRISDDGDISEPNGKIWSIRGATADMMEKYPGSVIKKYNGVSFLLSAKADEVIPSDKCKEYNGCTCIVTVGDSFVLMTDNKPYLQNCQGAREEYERDPRDTMARELKEELNIRCDPNRLKVIGYWTFLEEIELVDWELDFKSILFSLECDPFEISHTTDKFDKFQIIEYKTDETVFVAVIPFKELETIPELIYGKTFANYHREVLRRYLKLSPKYLSNYLKEFQMCH